tara:strand:- start:581 stop:1321 length:741 start_codon:yes stop_codon:yes gene_type:complete
MVSIDTVYQRVLALANKEQRGYITPLEYNLLANQAQMIIFEQYFYDLDIAKQVPTDTTSLSDMEELIQNKLKPFKIRGGVQDGTKYPLNNYRTGKIFVENAPGEVYEAEFVEANEINNYLNSTFHKAGLEKNPIYTDATYNSNAIGGDDDIHVYNHTGLLTPGPLDPFAVTCEITVRPNKVQWGYDVINERALYNATKSSDFELHDSEETELVYKILTLAGIVINKPGLASTAVGLDAAKLQQEKQ